MSLLANIAQIVFALIIVIILFVAGFAIYNYELVAAIANSTKTKKSIVIFDGVKDLGVNADEEYSTSDESHPLYRGLDGSVNQRPGIIYAYNFWVWKDSAGAGAVAPFATTSGGPGNAVVKTDSGLDTNSVVLVLKGVKKAYTYSSICGSQNQKTDIMIKSPLIKFEQGTDVLTVEFNTVGGPDPIVEDSRKTCDIQTRSWNNANAHKISLINFNDQNYIKRWFMVTVIVQDTFPLDPLPQRNNVRCRIYVNGRLELDKYISSQFLAGGNQSILQPNNGNLYVAPKISNGYQFNVPNKLYMANLTYFNYELTQADINKLYAAGYTNKSTNGNVDTTKVSLSMRSSPTVGVGLRATSPLKELS